MCTPVDLHRIQKISGGDSAFERELIGMYLTDAEKRIARLNDALGEGDYAAAKREAHSIKGASGNVGAQVMQQCALAIEEVCGANAVDASHPALSALDKAFTATRECFQRYMAEGATISTASPDESRPH